MSRQAFEKAFAKLALSIEEPISAVPWVSSNRTTQFPFGAVEPVEKNITVKGKKTSVSWFEGKTTPAGLTFKAPPPSKWIMAGEEGFTPGDESRRTVEQASEFYTQARHRFTLKNGSDLAALRATRDAVDEAITRNDLALEQTYERLCKVLNAWALMASHFRFDGWPSNAEELDWVRGPVLREVSRRKLGLKATIHGGFSDEIVKHTQPKPEAVIVSETHLLWQLATRPRSEGTAPEHIRAILEELGKKLSLPEPMVNSVQAGILYYVSKSLGTLDELEALSLQRIAYNALERDILKGNILDLDDYDLPYQNEAKQDRHGEHLHGNDFWGQWGRYVVNRNAILEQHGVKTLAARAKKISDLLAAKRAEEFKHTDKDPSDFGPKQLDRILEHHRTEGYVDP